MARGRYFDGSSAALREVELSRAGERLRIEGEGFVREVPLDELDFAPSRGRAPSRIGIRSGGLCELASTPETVALFAELGARHGFIDWLETHRTAILGSVLAFVCVGIVAWHWASR